MCVRVCVCESVYVCECVCVCVCVFNMLCSTITVAQLDWYSNCEASDVMLS